MPYRPIKRDISSRFLMEHPGLSRSRKFLEKLFLFSGGKLCERCVYLVLVNGKPLLDEYKIERDIG